MATELGIDPISGFGGDVADGSRDVTEPTPWYGCSDTCVQGSSRRVDERSVSGVGAVADDDRDRRIGYPAVDRHREVQAQHVAIS